MGDYMAYWHEVYTALIHNFADYLACEQALSLFGGSTKGLFTGYRLPICSDWSGGESSCYFLPLTFKFCKQLLSQKNALFRGPNSLTPSPKCQPPASGYKLFSCSFKN